MAVNHFGSKYHSVYNADSTFIICKSAKQENRTNFTEFFVYDVTEGKSIYQSADRVRSVEWVDNNLIMVRVLTGMPTGEGTNDDYTYNVTEKRIIK